MHVPLLRGVSAGPAPPSGAIRRALRNRVVKLLISVLLGCACVWLLHRGAFKLVPSRSALIAVDPWLVATYGALLLACNLLRAARWQLLLVPVARLPLGTVIRAALVGYAALLLLPLRAGEVVRPLLVRRTGKVSAWAATGTVGAERAIDGLFLSSILVAALVFSRPTAPSSTRIGDLPISASIVPHAAYAALGVFVASVAVMGIFYRWQAPAVRMLHGTIGMVSQRFADYVARRVERAASGFDFLRTPRFTLPFLAVTLLYWLGYAGTFLVLGRACGLSNMSFAHACVTMGTLGLGVVVPNAPGYFGAFQLSVYAGLSLYFSPGQVMGPGSAFVFVLYLCQVIVIIGCAAASISFEPTPPMLDSAHGDAKHGATGGQPDAPPLPPCSAPATPRT